MVAGTLLCGSLATASGPQGAPSPDVNPLPSSRVMDYAEQFVRATYSDLRSAGLMYSASVSGAWTDQRWRYDAVDVQINPSPLVTSIESMNDVARVLLNVQLKFDRRGLVSVWASGAHLSEAQRQRLSTAASQSADRWNVQQLRAQLRAAGAKYADDESMVRARLPLEQWKRVFGEVHVGRGQLNTPDPSVKGDDPATGEWSFVIDVSRPVGARFDVYVEPFEGRVVSMFRKD